MKFSTIVFCLAVLLLSSLNAAVTAECYWHAAYFDVIFWSWYGRGMRTEEERYRRDIIVRSQLVIRLDSLIKSQRHLGKLKHFKRWTLIEGFSKKEYVAGLKKRYGIECSEENHMFIKLTDSIAVNKALKKLWGIENVIISPSKQAGMWLFSLHVGLSKTRLRARPFPHGGYIHERPDSSLLWLQCHPDPAAAHCWYQHEIDGYYHQYTGLYLTRKNVLAAQRILLEKCNLKTTITSHYITPAIIRKYACY